MATKITSDVLESYMHCKFKGCLKLAGQQGTKCDYEAMLTELRAEVRLKAIDAILGRHSGEQVARNIHLTTAGLCGVGSTSSTAPLMTMPWRSISTG